MHIIKFDSGLVAGSAALVLGVLFLTSILRGLTDLKQGHPFYRRALRFSAVALYVIILNSVNY